MRVADHAERLAAALALAIYDAHPIYGSTAGWRGGIGGQAITQGCSFIDPPPDAEWTQYDLLSGPLRDFLAETPGFDLDAAKSAMRREFLAMLRPPAPPLTAEERAVVERFEQAADGLEETC